MNVDIYFRNKNKLDKKLSYFKKESLLIKNNDKFLANSHIDKAKHNLNFFNKNKNDTDYNDWLIVILYYALYHSALALVNHKNYNSKNHTATLLFLIKEYSISRDDIELLDNLYISQDEAKFYTELKSKRHSASYSTDSLFASQDVLYYRRKVVSFLEKTIKLIENNS